MSIQDVVYGGTGSRTETILGAQYHSIVEEIILGQVAALQMADESVCFVPFEDRQGQKKYNCFGFQKKNEKDLRLTAYAHYKICDEEDSITNEKDVFTIFRQLNYLTEAGFEELIKGKETNLTQLDQFSFDFTPRGLPKSYLKALLHGFFYQEEKTMTKLTLKKSVHTDIPSFQKEVMGILETFFQYLPNAMKKNAGFISHITKPDIKLEKGIKIVIYDRDFVDYPESIDLDKEEVIIEEKKIIQNNDLGVTKKETKAFVDWLVEAKEEEREQLFQEMDYFFPNDNIKLRCGSCKYIYLWNIVNNIFPKCNTTVQLVDIYYQISKQIQEKIIDINQDYLKEKIEKKVTKLGGNFEEASKQWAYAEIEKQIKQFSNITQISENLNYFLEKNLYPLGFTFPLEEEKIVSALQRRIIEILEQFTTIKELEEVLPYLEGQEICLEIAKQQYANLIIEEKIKPCKTMEQFSAIFEEVKEYSFAAIFQAIIAQYSKLIQKEHQLLMKNNTLSISEQKLSKIILFASQFFSWCNEELKQIKEKERKNCMDLIVNALGKTKLWTIKALKYFTSADTMDLEEIEDKREKLDKLRQKIIKINQGNATIYTVINQPIEDKIAQLERWMIQLEREEQEEQKEETQIVEQKENKKKKSAFKLDPKLFSLCILLICFITIFHSQKLSKSNLEPKQQLAEKEAMPEQEIQPDKFLNVQVGMRHIMGINEDESLWAWGNNEYGQLGDGTTKESTVQVKVLDYVEEVSVGYNFTVAIATKGSLWTWGCNKEGQLGDGTTKDNTKPKRIKQKGVFKQISAGSNHVMALTEDGDLWGWGDNYHGQLGNGNTKNQTKPILIMKEVKTVSAGHEYTMAIKKDGSLWAWGRNRNGQLGNGTVEEQHKPIEIPLKEVEKIYAGYGHTAAVKEDGSLWMWGYNGKGQLGDGTTKNHYQPIKSRVKEVKQVSLGYWYTTVVRENGDLWVWGYNQNGELIDETTQNVYYPKKVVKKEVAYVGAGSGYTIVVKKDNCAWTKAEKLPITKEQTGYTIEEESEERKEEIENLYASFLKAEDGWKEAELADYETIVYPPSDKEAINNKKKGIVSAQLIDLDGDKQKELITINFVPKEIKSDTIFYSNGTIATSLELNIYELEQKEWKEADTIQLSEYCLNGFSKEDSSVFLKFNPEKVYIGLTCSSKKEKESNPTIHKLFSYEEEKIKQEFLFCNPFPDKEDSSFYQLPLGEEKFSDFKENIPIEWKKIGDKKSNIFDKNCILLSRFNTFLDKEQKVNAQIYDATQLSQKLIWLKTLQD